MPRKKPESGPRPPDAKKTQKSRGVNSVGGFNPPPKETRWKKGCASPNPAGRPRTAEISQVVREALGRENPRTRRTELEAIVLNWVRRAKQGDTKKGELLFAYCFGRPKQSVGLEGELETLVRIIHIGAKGESGAGEQPLAQRLVSSN